MDKTALHERILTIVCQTSTELTPANMLVTYIASIIRVSAEIATATFTVQIHIVRHRSVIAAKPQRLQHRPLRALRHQRYTTGSLTSTTPNVPTTTTVYTVSGEQSTTAISTVYLDEMAKVGSDHLQSRRLRPKCISS